MKFLERIERVKAILSERGLDALMVFTPADLYYLSGYYPHMPWYPEDLFRLTPVIIKAKGEPIHVTGIVSTLRVQRIGAIKKIADYNEYTDDGIDFIGTLFEKEGLGNARIGFNQKRVVMQTYADLKARCPGIEWVPAADIVFEIRGVKDADELRLIHQACEINRAGLAAGTAAVKAGVAEKVVAAAAEHAMRVKGAERFTEETMVLSGQRTLQTRERASDKLIEDGDCVIMDMGAIYEGYCSDMATTTFAGTPRPEIKEMFEAAHKLHRDTVDFVRIGMKAGEVDAFARERCERMGIIQNAHLPHMVGHGMGLEFHEIPRIMPGSEDVLQPNMVFTIEPSIRVPGVGAIRLEEVYRLTESGVVKA